ncbi:MAG: Rpp14/Pop5 family protein [Methanothrix sp.]
MIRDKKRYIMLESASELNMEKDELDRALKQAILSLVGQLGYYYISPKLVLLIDGKHFVIRCRLQGYESMLLASALIKRLGTTETGLYTLKSSGTIKALMKEVHSKDLTND